MTTSEQFEFSDNQDYLNAWDRALAEKPYREMASNAKNAERVAAADTLERLAVFAGDRAENNQDFSPSVIRNYAEGYQDEEHIIFAAYNLAGIIADYPRPPAHKIDDIVYARSLYTYHPALYPNIKKPFPIGHPLIQKEVDDVVALTGARLDEEYPLIGFNDNGITKTGVKMTGSSYLGPDITGPSIELRRVPDVTVAILAIPQPIGKK